MQPKENLRVLILGFLIMVLLASCSGSSSNGAAGSIEAYISALVERDENLLVNLSCASWESQARAEYNSFAAVKISLENLECQDRGVEGSYTLVDCTGKILANYGAEDLEIDLSGQTYQALEEGGEWRMCGYH